MSRPWSLEEDLFIATLFDRGETPYNIHCAFRLRFPSSPRSVNSISRRYWAAVDRTEDLRNERKHRERVALLGPLDELYAKLDSYPDCRIRFPSETLWGKVLPHGLYIINNNPLTAPWRLHDIVDSETPRSTSNLMYRRWKGCLVFKHKQGEGEAGRKRIYDSIKSMGLLCFLFDGLAMLLTQARSASEAERLTPEVQSEINRRLDALALAPDVESATG